MQAPTALARLRFAEKPEGIAGVSVKPTLTRPDWKQHNLNSFRVRESLTLPLSRLGVIQRNNDLAAL